MRNPLRTYLEKRDDLWAGRGDDVIALHGPDGRFKRVSASAEGVLGRSAASLVGGRLTDVVRAEDHALVLSGLAGAAKEDRARFECRIDHPSGPRRVEISLARTARGLRSVIRDCEERAGRERAIQAESADAAWFANKRTEHLVNVSHEIRTPLSAVIGFADALQRESFGPVGHDKYRDYARLIHDSGQHLLSLVTDLLDLSKAEANEVALEREAVRVEDLVRVCADIVRLQAEEAGLYVKVEVETELPRLMLDPKVIRQIVLNLLSNALKFTEQGGVTLRVGIEDGMLVLTVQDTGVGMSPGDLALVGRRFKQARTEGVRGARGTGIGLSLSQALARVHGGELQLASAVGAGTTARLTLPLDQAPPAEKNGKVTSLDAHRSA